MIVAAAFGVGVLLLYGFWFIYDEESQPDRPPPFYTAPADLPAGAPGTIVRSEPVSGVTGARTWRILYTSTDPDGGQIAVSGVVVAPNGDVPDGGRPIVAWAHGTTGIASRCAPSLEARAGTSLVPEIDRLLDAGAVVAITDYPGLGTAGPHPYLVGESEGRAVLDSVRAARSLVGDEAGATVTVFGHSQGGHAALFADDLASTYAPELHVAGVAAMAPPTDLGALVERDRNETPGVLLTALALDSWSQLYPELDVGTVVHPSARRPMERLARNCIETTEQSVDDLPEIIELRERFLSADPADAPGWSTYLAANAATSVDHGVPLLVAQGLDDVMVRPDVTQQFVQQRCAAGATIEYDTYPDVGHFAVRTVAAPSVVTWLIDRMEGEPVSAGCTGV
jgi:alpha-beta hydrolase superfamily lysophospholipase